MKEDSYTSCEPDVRLRFRYTYNMKESDAFDHEVDRVQVWVFGHDGKFISQHADDIDHANDDYSLHIPALSSGDYTFVAWCRSMEHSKDDSNYDHAEMIPGISSITDLTARLPLMENNYYQTQLNGTLNGIASANLKGGEQTITVDMLKCTNTLRIILMPYHTSQRLDSKDFLFYVTDRNAWLDYDASIYEDYPVIYRPYYKATLYDGQAEESGIDPAYNVVVAEMNMSRLFYELGPRLIIKDSKSSETLMDINLTWLLSLQAIGDRRSEWSEQEYLDRQDTYSVTFFIDGDVLMQNHIIVNGWNISLESNELR